VGTNPVGGFGVTDPSVLPISSVMTEKSAPDNEAIINTSRGHIDITRIPLIQTLFILT
jgi:hypothetical protein